MLSSRTHNRSPNLGIWQRDRESPGNLTLEASGIWLQNFHRTGETDSWKAQTTLSAPGPRRKEQWPHKRLIQTCLWVSRSLRQRPSRWWSATGLGALSVAAHAWDLLKEVTIIFITSTIVWAQVNNREGTQLHQQKIGLKIYWAWPWPSEQDPVSSQVCRSHQEASISLLSFSITGKTDWKP